MIGTGANEVDPGNRTYQTIFEYQFLDRLTSQLVRVLDEFSPATYLLWKSFRRHIPSLHYVLIPPGSLSSLSTKPLPDLISSIINPPSLHPLSLYMGRSIAGHSEITIPHPIFFRHHLFTCWCGTLCFFKIKFFFHFRLLLELQWS